MKIAFQHFIGKHDHLIKVYEINGIFTYEIEDLRQPEDSNFRYYTDKQPFKTIHEALAAGFTFHTNHLTT